MTRVILSICGAMLLSLSLPAAGEKVEKEKPTAVPTLESAEGIDALKAFVKRFKPTVDRYKSALTRAKESAARKGDVEEVKRLDDAISVGASPDFISYPAKAARKSYLGGRDRAIKSLILDLKTAMKKVLAKDMEEAERIQATIDMIEDVPVAGAPRSFKIDANKDWQGTGIEISKGITVTFNVSGKWSTGARRKIAKGKWEDIYGDADTYNIQVKVGDSAPRNGGVKFEQTAPKSGELMARMKPYRYRARLGEAKGSVLVKVSFESINKTDPLEDILAQLMTQAGNKPPEEEKPAAATEPAPAEEKDPEVEAKAPMSGMTKIMTLKAGGGWQDTLVNVTKGQKVTIKAEGKWSSGKKTKKKKDDGFVYHDANKLKIAASVEETPTGRGGIDWSFTAPLTGTVFLRMADRDSFRKKRLQPRGSLKVTVTAEGE